MDEIHLKWRKERPRYKALRDWNPAMIPMIKDRHPDTVQDSYSNITRVITGGMGHGKTTFAFKLMAKLKYDVEGYTKIDDEEPCYLFALDNMIYRPDDLFSRMEAQLDVGLPDWIWTIDDASIHMGKQLYRQDRQAYDKLEDNLPTIREYVTCLLITTPKAGNLAKPFRDFFDSKVKVTLEEGIKRNTRRGKHYFKDYYPDDVHYRIYHPYDDKYSCLVPEPYYGMLRAKKLDALREYHAVKRRKSIREEYEEEYEDEPG